MLVSPRDFPDVEDSSLRGERQVILLAVVTVQVLLQRKRDIADKKLQLLSIGVRLSLSQPSGEIW